MLRKLKNIQGALIWHILFQCRILKSWAFFNATVLFHTMPKAYKFYSVPLMMIWVAWNFLSNFKLFRLIQFSCLICKSIVTLLHNNSRDIPKKNYFFTTDLSFKTQLYYSDAPACGTSKTFQQKPSGPLIIECLNIPVLCLLPGHRR